MMAVMMLPCDERCQELHRSHFPCYRVCGL
jgi:hypothetical protein